jgi:hypothetical protein
VERPQSTEMVHHLDLVHYHNHRRLPAPRNGEQQPNRPIPRHPIPLFNWIRHPTRHSTSSTLHSLLPPRRTSHQTASSYPWLPSPIYRKLSFLVYTLLIIQSTYRCCRLMSSVGSALIVKRCGLRIRRVNKGARIGSACHGCVRCHLRFVVQFFIG